MIKPILPPATIGIVGGGQLGRMLAQAAKTMGYTVGVLDPTPNAPAGQVADFQLQADYDDHQALDELARRSDVLTYEFENVDLAALQEASKQAALPQGTQLLAITRDRVKEKTFLRDHGVPTADFAAVPERAALIPAIHAVGVPAILKTTTGGYDGHGQLDINSDQDLPAAEALVAKTPCILEARVAFDRELSLMVTRDGQDVVRCFPVVENHHQDHILHVTIAPAPDLGKPEQYQIDSLATKIATALNLRGVLGIELFAGKTGVLVNELAPRPHNSGHYSIEACNFSQFQAHILSICGLPIPKVRMKECAVMRNLLGDDLAAAKAAWPKHPEWHLHDYGKAEARPGRKMGHLTVLAGDTKDLMGSIQLEDEDGKD
ncbi:MULTISPECIES: 5-(carboxyamino)imidazole ribonucleotide synthase [unclassified Lacticaseibacillus]|uniref:5-(carboxyamino)imidazole ribonucleotide synthase n=1 Tax=unclassified Lacticaseibacillus TaxID=2759744 RepID=UPI001942A470|nr:MULTISPECIES: 5-(carboxyamino)imidazole ribonucleotide synthase [unclassified Lacticaseibacillus]